MDRVLHRSNKTEWWVLGVTDPGRTKERAEITWKKTIRKGDHMDCGHFGPDSSRVGKIVRGGEKRKIP